MFASDMADIMARMAPLFGVMRAAAKTEPDIDEMLHRMLMERAENMKFLLNALLVNGPLQEGLSIDEAAETVWALSSAEVYTLLVTDRGWSTEQYTRWLANALYKLLS